ncbi:hypothetical protein ACIP2X_38105 [Streptomyces sp. NPDC089424]|uniref:hypothetical protein n=1 Tax=Streptomyces sp. NPDC089424 TaxID=3365917 RepID=UPI0037FADD51
MSLWGRLFGHRRHPSAGPQAQERPDPDRIAVLEDELLGITPEPGTRAARAVALAKPVDQTACPHDDVIEVVEMGQVRATGICEHCGARMVATDTGDWQLP